MEYISAEQKAQLSQVFRTLAEQYAQTRDQSIQTTTRVISKDELGEVMDCIGVHATEDELVSMIAAVDVDGTGHIDEDEFINIMTRKMRDCRPQQELQEVFDYFDRDKDGKISKGELARVANELDIDITEAEAETILEEASAETGNDFRLETLHKLMSANIPDDEERSTE
eukprot:gb/GECG01012678.1/.p1 GENE.gb/GECG01012678.1/~~gb/GECG01012678.1/.p1  ORF type:complete len:170 (+),score=36.57 gb/GECG01012678.1/:1-510(+)